MSIQSEITRITTDRNSIRTKLVALGLATSTDDLDDLAEEIKGIADRGTPSASVQEGDSYTIQPGYYRGGSVQGVSGGGNYSLQAKTGIVPTKSAQTVTADQGYYGLSSVGVSAIPDAYQDVSSVTAAASDVLANKTFVPASGTLTAGTMPNIGAVSKTLDATSNNQSYTVPSGYHNGSGSVSITLEEKTATPDTVAQNITPTSGKVLSKVTVSAIPSNFVDATDVDASAANLLDGTFAVVKTGENQYSVAEGTMTNNGAVSATLDATEDNQSYTIPSGYHNGSGSVGIVLETKSTTPSATSQIITPTDGKVLSKVTVSAIPSNYVNSSSVTTTAAHVLDGDYAVVKTGTNSWAVAEGTMPNIGTQTATLDTATGHQSVAIAEGYHNGAGSVSIVLEQKTATPSTSSQAITPSSGKVLSRVTVNPIPSNYVNSSSVTATAANVLDNTRAVVKTGTNTYQVVEGTMANNGAVSSTIDGLTAMSVTIPSGYTTGGTVSLTNDIETALAAI